MGISQDINIRIEKIGMLLLALYPISFYYMAPLPLSYGQLLFLALLIIMLVSYGLKSFISIPKRITIFWIYAAIILLIFSQSIKITYLIPGGIQFFIWILILGICVRSFNIIYLRKYMRIIFVLSAIIFVFQELMVLSKGTRFVTILPISDTFSYGGLTYSGLISKQIYADRSSSLFMEPAYFAQYALCSLALEFFCVEVKDKLLTRYSLFIILILLILQSGIGLVGLLLLGFIKFLMIMKKLSMKKRLSYFFILVPLVLSLVFFYSQSEIGASLIERTDELNSDESSAFLRIFFGYYIYSYLPVINMIFGLPIDVLENIIPSYLTSNDNSIFLNGFQTLLITNGIIGVVLLFSIYIQCFKKGSILIKSLVWLLLLLSLTEQIYLMPYMLLLSVIIFGSKKENMYTKFVN